MPSRIAILGWGSLLWDARPDFDALHGSWWNDGPLLKIEFSRISKSRSGALTLVLDPVNGASSRVAYCLSRRIELSQVVEDLKSREGTTLKNIGYIDANGARNYRDRKTVSPIISWAAAKKLDGVVWTDLPSNFVEKTGERFSPERAMAYLNALNSEAAKVVLEYIHKAPIFIQTPLRKALREQTQIE